MAQGYDQPGPGWNPLTGKRIFKSAREAWLIYGKYRFSVSPRTFYTYVGKKGDCPPRADGCFYVEDIEIIAQSRAWAPTSSFVQGVQPGGEGGSSSINNDQGFKLQAAKIRQAEAEAELKEMELARKRRELMPRSEYEQRLAAAGAVVGTEAETFVYDKVREIIHVCEGKPEKEDSLREYLLREVRTWLHAFSRPVDYEISFLPIDDNEGSQQNNLTGLTDETGDID